MLTEDFTPWLIEINSSPDLAPTTSVTARLCPQCLEDVIKGCNVTKLDKYSYNHVHITMILLYSGSRSAIQCGRRHWHIRVSLQAGHPQGAGVPRPLALYQWKAAPQEAAQGTQTSSQERDPVGTSYSHR